MRIFFDTEFTGLHKNTTLISLGMISEDGKKFYAEFTDYHKSQVNDWIKENVIDNCRWLSSKEVKVVNNYISIDSNGECFGTKWFVKEVLTEWLSQFESVELYSDCSHYDMVLFVDIFGTAFDLPKNVSPVCHDINQDIAKALKISEREAFDFPRSSLVPYEKLKSFNGDKHNALYDAEVIKACYEKITKGLCD